MNARTLSRVNRAGRSGSLASFADRLQPGNEYADDPFLTSIDRRNGNAGFRS
jgi:hypothetical protein